MNVPGPWACDTCGQPIATLDEGVLVWYAEVGVNAGVPAREPRIVHADGFSRRPPPQGCIPSPGFIAGRAISTSDVSLANFSGPDGLVNLLEWYREGTFELDAVVVVIQRLFIPLFEEARPYLKRALSDGTIEQDRADGFYSQSQLRAVIEAIPRLTQW